MTFTTAFLSAQTPPPAAVPAAYQDLFTTEQNTISNFDQTILQSWDGTKAPVTFSTHLGNANSALGATLLDPAHYSAVLLEMDSLKALGDKSISLSIDYPTLEPAFDAFGGNAAGYLAFYQQVFADARARGLKVIVETGPLFSDPSFSNVNVMPFYNTLTPASYGEGRANHALLIAQQLQPDFLSVIQEPDTEASQTGMADLGTVSGSTALLNQILDTYRQAGATVPIGAGVGSWIASYQSYIQNFTATSVDFIDMHVYPSNRDFLNRALTIADMATAAGKQIGMSEMWLNKLGDPELGVLTNAQVFSRSVYSFYAPLDAQFLQAMVHLAHYKKLAYAAPFYSRYFRGYLDYDPSYEGLSYPQLSNLAAAVQTPNIMTGVYNDIGALWQSLIVDTPDTTAPAAPMVSTSSLNPHGVMLSWPVTDDNVGTAGYIVSRDGVSVSQTAMTSFYDGNLNDGVSYTYTVSAFDLAGNITASTPITVTTPDASAPTTPTGVTLTADGSQINLTWAAATDNVGVTSYVVTRGVNGGPLSPVASVTDTSYSQPSQSATTYCFQVVAMDAAGIPSPYSAPSCMTTPDTTAPTVPTNLAVISVTSNQVRIAWTPSTDTVAVTGYQIQRGDNGGAIRVIGTSATADFVDTTAAPKMTYNYRVAAFDAAGNISLLSAGVVVTTPSLPDTTAPTVNFTSPAPDSTNSLMMLISATVQDLAGPGQATSGVAGVRFLVDGMDAAPELTAGPYYVKFNTRTVANGTHTVTVIARDAAGNTVTTPALSFIVRN